MFRSHEDDPLRGVLAAIAIRDQLSTLNMECSIGVRYFFLLFSFSFLFFLCSVLIYHLVVLGKHSVGTTEAKVTIAESIFFKGGSR